MLRGKVTTPAPVGRARRWLTRLVLKSGLAHAHAGGHHTCWDHETSALLALDRPGTGPEEMESWRGGQVWSLAQPEHYGSEDAGHGNPRRAPRSWTDRTPYRRRWRCITCVAACPLDDSCSFTCVYALLASFAYSWSRMCMHEISFIFKMFSFSVFIFTNRSWCNWDWLHMLDGRFKLTAGLLNSHEFRFHCNLDEYGNLMESWNISFHLKLQ